MELLDVVVVGGGPAGTTCAGILKKHGLSVAIVDKAVFPRSKLCAGWVTPSVFDILSIPPEEYAKKNKLQQISSFVVWDARGNAHPVDFKNTVSYGIIRKEFDNYLLKKSGVELHGNIHVGEINFLPDRVEIQKTFSARMIVGAGGHFCPVSLSLGNSLSDAYTLAAMESETEFDEQVIKKYVPFPGSPEVIYLDDLKGYAWYFSKGNYLNIGIGSLKRKDIRQQLGIFLEMLKTSGRLPDELRRQLSPFTGHAYKIYPGGKRTLVGERALLIGDSAGLADNTSGEGIRPAVVSAALAAETIIEADGDYSFSKLKAYNEKIVSSFGKPDAPPESRDLSAFEKLLFKKLLLGTQPGRRYIINNLFLEPLPKLQVP